jgi:hypothetical protein
MENSLQTFDKVFAGVTADTETYLMATVTAHQMTAATNTLRYTVEFQGSGEFSKYQATYKDVAVPKGEKLNVQLGKSFQQYSTP